MLNRASVMNGKGKPLVTHRIAHRQETHMAVCEVCKNDYDKSFNVVMRGEQHTFDSFECAIHALAPTCAHCDCRIVGHGIESNGTYYCCASCARASGIANAKDRADRQAA
jgi:hypothetical protein